MDKWRNLDHGGVGRRPEVVLRSSSVGVLGSVEYLEQGLELRALMVSAVLVALVRWVLPESALHRLLQDS